MSANACSSVRLRVTRFRVQAASLGFCFRFWLLGFRLRLSHTGVTLQALDLRLQAFAFRVSPSGFRYQAFAFRRHACGSTGFGEPCLRYSRDRKPWATVNQAVTKPCGRGPTGFGEPFFCFHRVWRTLCSRPHRVWRTLFLLPQGLANPLPVAPQGLGEPCLRVDRVR